MNSNPRTEWLREPGGLAERLRSLRQGAETFGTARAFAEAAGMTPSKVSRIENGLIFPSGEDIRRWVATTSGDPTVADELVALAAAGETMWADRKRILREGLAAAQADVDELVRESTRIAFFETTIIPGPLQTAGYMSALLPRLSAAEISNEDLAKAIATKQRRWEALFDRSKAWELVMLESVMHLWPGPEGGRVMQAQLLHIGTLLGLPNVRIGVIPMDRGLGVWPSTPFAIYDDTVMVEVFSGADTHSGETAAEYGDWLARLWLDAVEDPADLSAMLARAIDATTR